jgi:hypothetical protein
MKILNIELSKNEEVGINTKKHGGGAIFLRWAKQILKDEFFILAPKECYENLSLEDYTKNCLILPDPAIETLKNGYPIFDLLPNANDYDIIIHNQENFAFNLNGIKAKQVCWLSFINQTVHPLNHACFIYSYDQKQRVFSPTKTYKIQIGDYVPEVFSPIENENFLFQCTRLDSVMNPNKFVDLCNKHKIKGLFAGPILEHIDNINTFYLGLISNEKKLELCKKARLFNCCQSWETIFNLSAISALGQGCPIIANKEKNGCFRYLVEENKNGFFFDGNEDNFLDIWNKSSIINRQAIWETAKKWNQIEMVKSFYGSFEKIIYDK